MFTWLYEDSMDVDLPLQKAWNFYTDPTNWSKWEDRFESFELVGGLRAGAEIKAKVKNKCAQARILVTEVKSYQECKLSVKVVFFTQESMCIFQEISPEKTRITLKVCIISFLTPFMKSFFLRTAEKSRLKRSDAFKEFAGQT